jgi:hypothetical protein
VWRMGQGRYGVDRPMKMVLGELLGRKSCPIAGKSGVA